MAAKLKYLESSLEEWKSIMPDENTENVKPHQIREKIKHLQNQELILTNEVAQNEMKQVLIIFIQAAIFSKKIILRTYDITLSYILRQLDLFYRFLI